MSDDDRVFANSEYPPTRFLEAVSAGDVARVIDIKRLAALSYKVKPSDILAAASSFPEINLYINAIAVIRFIAIREIFEDLDSGKMEKKEARSSTLGHQKISIIIKKARKVAAERAHKAGGKASETKSESKAKDRQLVLLYSTPYSLLELRCVASSLGAYMPHGGLPSTREEGLLAISIALIDVLLNANSV
jgi:hypothetical protein